VQLLKLLMLFLVLISSCSTESSAPTIASPTTNVIPTAPSEDSVELWQLPSQSNSQMMSYVLKRADRDLVVIDGGQTADAEYLKAFTKGQTINAWIITHTHPDHVNALISLLQSNAAPKIDRIYWAYVDRDWLLREQSSNVKLYDNFLSAVKASRIPLHALSPYERFTVGALDFVVLTVANPELPGINNSSLVFKLLTSSTVLFLGDLVDESPLLPNMVDLLPSDIVQMSHHGQTGLTKEVYRTINPKICLWPTTRWLWDNDDGRGPGSGIWTTPETRSWMSELGVQQHIVQADGLQKVLLSVSTTTGE
jgi:beta-lactamase superfamily II metal-dependent hydrolase